MFKQKEIILMLIVLFLSSCNYQPSQNSGTTIEVVSVIEVGTPEPDKTPLFNTEVTPVIVNEFIQTITNTLTLSAGDTATPTILPQATLTLNQKNEVISGLLSDENCPLPCFWGLIPAEKLPSDSQRNLVWNGLFTQYNDSAFVNTEYYAISVQLEVKDQTVKSIYINSSSNENAWSREESQDWENYYISQEDRLNPKGYMRPEWRRFAIDQIVKKFGLPTQAYIYRAFEPDFYSAPSYFFILLYEQQGMVISYVGNVYSGVSIDDGQTYDIERNKSRACLNLLVMTGLDLFLYDTNTISSTIALHTIMPPDSVPFVTNEKAYELTKWETATGQSLAVLNNLVDGSINNCFDFLDYMDE